MKALWFALGIVGAIPLLAEAQSYGPSRSVIKPVGFSIFAKGGCSSCAEPVPTCCTPMPHPSIGKCCPRPCLLEKLRRGLRSLDSLLPCGLACHSPCAPSCGSSCHSCTASCEVKSSCKSCCTKSRAHFFAFCKPKRCSPCGSSCCDAMPVEMMGHPPVPQPMSDDPFKDDVRPMQPMNPMDPNAPPPGQETYKPYWKKNRATAEVATPARRPTPAQLDPYAVAPPVHIKARPVKATVKVASRLPETVTPEYAAVKVVSAQEVAPVSMSIADDEPPAPPMLLPAATARAAAPSIDRSIPLNPLR